MFRFVWLLALYIFDNHIYAHSMALSVCVCECGCVGVRVLLCCISWAVVQPL